MTHTYSKSDTQDFVKSCVSFLRTGLPIHNSSVFDACRLFYDVEFVYGFKYFIVSYTMNLRWMSPYAPP